MEGQITEKPPNSDGLNSQSSTHYFEAGSTSQANYEVVEIAEQSKNNLKFNKLLSSKLLKFKKIVESNKNINKI